MAEIACFPNPKVTPIPSLQPAIHSLILVVHLHLRTIVLKSTVKHEIWRSNMMTKEDKIWDKAWRAQQAHVHRPKEGRAHPLCGPLTKPRPRLAHQVSENLLYKDEACSVRMKLALQGWGLLCKDEACSTRMKLALQEWDLLCKDETCSTRKGGRNSLL